MRIELTLNGSPRCIEVGPGESARDLLRRLGMSSVRNGCDGEGSCGVCSILLDGRLVNTCLLLAPQLEGRSVRTIEGLSEPRQLSPLQSAFIDTGVVQCGYCTPAMLLAAHELLDRVDAPTREETVDAFSGVFCRCTGYEQFHDAIVLARKRRSAPDTPVELPEFRPDLRHVGKGRRKVDGSVLVRGGRAFVDDQIRDDCTHLVILRSPHAHAYITRIDTSAAESMPGVIQVITHLNCPDAHYTQAGQGFPEPSPYDMRMFGQKVRYVGDRVAAVVAETEDQARAALATIEVDYEKLEPVLSVDDAARPGAPIVHNSAIEFVTGGPDHIDNSGADPRDGKVIYPFPIHGDPHRNIAAFVDGGIGDVEVGFAEADVIVERTYETKQVQCTPLEPHVTFAELDGDRLIVHASTQVPWHVRRVLAAVLGVQQNQIRVIKARNGGAFGAKQDYVTEDVTAFAAWATGRPVLHRFTREEEFIASRTRHPMRITVKLGAKRDGTLTAMTMDVRANTGPYGEHCLTVPMNACSKSLPLFMCPNVHFDVTTYYSNIPPAGAYQGYGAPQGNYAMQMAAVELADELGMDPLAFMNKNRVEEGSMLEILKCLGEGREGVPQEVFSCGLGRALDRGAELIEWGERVESDDPDVRIGKGVAMVQQGSGLPGLDSANAAMLQNGDGTFILLSGGTDLGTGLDTVTTKMAAEVLCVDMEHIALVAADTDVTPFDVGAYASSGTYFSGGAAKAAAEDMKAQILEVAAELLGEPQADLELALPLEVRGKTASVSFRDIALYTQSGVGRGQLVATGSFTTDKASFPYGAHFCQVAVHMRTGKVQIQKYYALQDCGTPINPELALGQVYGGVLRTIGPALSEEMILDEQGRCLNPTLLDYGVPRVGDLPTDFRAELIETNDPYGPYGCKSIAEMSCNGAAPVIAAAIHDATGVWMRSWPFTPEKVLRALGTL